jgi:hypothetical protein
MVLQVTRKESQMNNELARDIRRWITFLVILLLIFGVIIPFAEGFFFGRIRS